MGRVALFDGLDCRDGKRCTRKGRILLGNLPPQKSRGECSFAAGASGYCESAVTESQYMRRGSDGVFNAIQLSDATFPV